MKVTPKTEVQIAEEGLLPKGEYFFEVVDATDKLSKKGSEMIKLDLAISTDDGDRRFISDYLLDAIAYKVRHAADACGLLAKYEAGELVGADFINCSGRCKIIIKEDKTGQYPPSNSVTDYIKNGAVAGAVGNAAPDIDDEIPF